jgi:hypothetical protein
MKKLITLLFFFFLLSISTFGQSKKNSTYVKSYTKKDGTTVKAHYKSKPDKTTNNNYSTKGNTNPYTGKKGTKKSKK